MSLSDIAKVTLTRSSVFPTRAGFGVPLLVAFHAATPNKIDFYKSIAGVAADHATTSTVYKMAQKAFSQNPCPSLIAVGKRIVGTTQIVTLTPKLTTAGLHYIFDYVSPAGVSTHVDYTVGGSDTPTIIAAALATQLSAITGATAAAAAGVLTITASTAGALFDLQNLPALLQLSIKNTTTDPGITADLTAINAVDGSTWYGINLDSNSKAEILAAAAWTEATRKLLFVQSSDSEIADNAVSNDVASALKAAAYARTGIIYAQNRLNGYRAVGLMAKMFTTTPGASTWEYQTIASDTVDTIDDGSVTKIWAKNCATYTTLAGLNLTFNVKVATSEPVDLVPGTDKLYARIQEAVVGLFATASNSGSKIPYTDDGIAQVVNVVKGQLNQAVKDGFIKSDYVVTFPRAADIDAPTKASRLLPNIVFTANMQGAIHTVQIVGTLSF